MTENKKCSDCKNCWKTKLVDAVPVVHGRWIFNRYHTWECGNCGFHPFKGYIPKEPNFNFCPNCGCRMDGGDDEQ